MNKVKNILIASAAIVSLPLTLPFIIFGLLFYAVFLLFTEPFHILKYRKSAYFTDLGIRYHIGVLNEDGYQFYNEAIKTNTDFKLIHHHTDDYTIDYVIYHHHVYLFSGGMGEFEGIYYDDAKGEWVIIDDGDAISLESVWDSYKDSLDLPDDQGNPIILLLTKDHLLPRNFDENSENDADRAIEMLPGYVTLVDSYTDILKANSS